MSRTRLLGAIAAMIGLAALGSCTDDSSVDTPLAPDALSEAKFFNQNDFEQCQTGNPRDPDDAGPLEPECNWINGVINSTHAVLFEDDANPQKLIIPSASTTDNYIILQYGLQKDIHGNYDGLVRYDNGTGPFNPCTDTQTKMGQFCDSGELDATVPVATGDVPAVTPGAALAAATTAMDAFHLRYKGGSQAARQIVIYGADFVDVDDPTFVASGDAVLAEIKINFTRDPAWTGDLLALWGMHVAFVGDWSQAECETLIDCTGAAGQSGAPFHTKLQEYWNGTDLVQPGAMALNMMGDVVVRNPTAWIELSPLTDTNSIEEEHTVTVTVTKDLDDGNGPQPATDADVDFSLTNDATSSYVLDAASSTCDDAGINVDANGQCVIVFTSTSAGTVTINASATVDLAGETAVVTTDGTGNNTGAATKDFVDGSIAWNKVDGLGAPLAGATFDVCLIELWDSDLNGGLGGYTDVADDCHVVSDATAGPAGSNWYDDQDLDGGEFLLDPVVLGKYTVQENTAPAGYNKDPDLETVSLSLSSPDATIAQAFVNTAPALRISISPLDDDNSIGEDHTLTAHAEKDVLGNGSWVDVEDGVTLTFAIESGTASFVGGVNTCQTSGGTGQCSVDITSNTAGTVYVSAAVSLTIGSVLLNAKTGTGGENSANARKDFIDGSIAWNKVDGMGAPLAGATFDVCLIELWDSDANGGAGGYTDVADECHVVSDATAGPVGTNWWDDQDTDGGDFLLDPLVLGKYTVQEKDPPSSDYNVDPDLETVSLSLSSPDATIAAAFVNPKPALKISITPLTGQNSIEDDHTLTATAMYDPEGDGSFVAVPDGSTIQFAFETNAIGATFVGPSSCATVGGSCSAVITSDNAGQVEVSAAIALTVGAVNLNAKTGTGGLNGANATKDFIAGMLYWEKRADSSTGPLQGGATFEVCRTHDYDPATASFSAITPVCFNPDILDNDSRDQDAANGKFKLIDLVLGRYTIRETIAPFGYMKDPNTHTVDVTSSSVVDGGIFVNLPLTRGELHPTQTDCEDFRDETATPLDFLYAQRKGTVINNVSPGVFFFYTEVLLAENGGSIRVTEINAALPLFQILNGQAFLYSDDCVKLATMNLINGDTGAQIAPAGGMAGDTYIIGIKYATDALNGESYNALPEDYTFTAEASFGAGWLFLNSDMLTVVKKN